MAAPARGKKGPKSPSRAPKPALPSKPPRDIAQERALLERWRTTRSPLLADTLQRLAGDEWVARMKGLARLNTERARAQLPRAITLDDPRMTVFLVECLLAPRWPSTGGRPIWSSIFERLVALRDSRALEPLRRALETPPHFMGIAHTKWMLAELQLAVSALEEACRGLPQDDEITRALAAGATGLRPARPGGYFGGKAKQSTGLQGLLEAVWARPDDDATRLVVADALLEQNDPWGEFITLQFRIASGQATAVEQKRAASLLHVNAQRFGGPIAHIATKDSWAFEKGFLVSCSADRSMVPRRRWEDAASAPHWATVRSVTLDTHAPQWWVTAWASNPALQRLTEVRFRSIVLVRASAVAPWQVSKANKRLEFDEGKYFRAFLAGLSPAARAALVTSHPGLEEIRTVS
ncbi:MAG: TIGR02996 domain-containing protein [Archangium sp.]|nr:TIGR02996 domain-containing protein [Archangium sp.]